MPRSIWKGTIAFGLVNVPVSLYSGERRTDIAMHMVDSRNHARIRYERVNEETGEEVPWDSMVKGYEYDDGKFVYLSEEDLDKVEPKLTKTIEIADFVDLADIDATYFDKPYILEPDKRGRKTYALLRETLRLTGKVGIGQVVIRTRAYLAALMVKGNALLLMLLRYAQELQKIENLDLPDLEKEDVKLTKKEIDMAVRLVEEMSSKWEPEKYEDEYRAALLGYIEEKVKAGKTEEAKVPKKRAKKEEEEPEEKVVDLMDYLRQSVEKAGGKKAAGSAPAKKAPAKKATSTRRKKSA